MKRIFFIVLIFLSVNTSAQIYPITQNLGSPSTAVEDKGGLFVRGAFVPPQFTDTTAANAALHTKFYPGNQINTTSDNLYWYRSTDTTKWIKMGSGSGGSGTDSASFHTITQGSDSSYAKFNRPNGTGTVLKVVYDTTNSGGGSGVKSVTGNIVDNTDPLNPVVNGVSQSQLDDSIAEIRVGLTWEQTLQNQGENAFSSDNNVDLGGHGLEFDNIGSLNINADNGGGIHTSESGINIRHDGDTSLSEIATFGNNDVGSIASIGSSSNNGNEHVISVSPNLINITGNESIGLTTNLQIDNLDSSNANSNNIAWFDENNILHRGALNKFYGTIQLKNYTVSTLPTGVQGMTAYVTDAAATPTWGGTATGGGSTVVKVFYNGTAWIYE